MKSEKEIKERFNEIAKYRNELGDTGIESLRGYSRALRWVLDIER